MRTTAQWLAAGLVIIALGRTAVRADDVAGGHVQAVRTQQRVAQAPARPSAPAGSAPGSQPGTAPAPRTPSATTPGSAAQPGTPAQPTQPQPAAPSALPASPAAPAYNPAFASNAAATLSAAGFGTLASVSTGGIPQMIGDLPPFSLHGLQSFQSLGGLAPAPPPTQPGAPGGQPPTTLPPINNHPINHRPISPVFRITAPTLAVKISENQSPIPVDRVFGQFNFYGSVNTSYNQRVSPQIGNVQAYFQLYGFEKTFLDGHASVGLRETVASVNVDSHGPQVPGGMFTSSGNMDVFTKFILFHDDAYRNILTGGLDVSMPVGPASFGGYPNAVAFRDTHIQPFIGYLLTRDRLFFQGFSSISAATDPNDVSFFFNDIGLGYYVYRDFDPSSFLNAIVPTFETHVNTPLDHGGFRPFDPASQPDSVNFTFGTTFILDQRLYLTIAYTTPVSGPRPFEGEVAVQLNYRFGGLLGRQPMLSVPPPPTF